MRILQLPSWYLPEGGQFCLNQSLALQERGIEVHILANVVLPWRKYKFSVLRYPFNSFFTVENDIPMYRYYSWKYPFVDIPNIEKWTKKTVNLFDQYKEKYGMPDIIHVHSSMWGGYTAALIKEKYGVPYVITEHRGIFGAVSDYAKSLLKPSYLPYLSKSFSSADYIIPVSSQLIPKIQEICRCDVKIKPIPNILDTDFFHPIERKKSTQGVFTFVSVNGFNPSKGYEFLLPAFDLVCDECSNVHLRIVGENFEKKEFQLLLNQTKNKGKISFAGEVNRKGVRQELWSSDAFVIASRIEAQSVATIEALSTGLPVVGTAITPKEILTEECGYIVPIENIPALADGMVKMIKNKEFFDGNKISEHTRMMVSKGQITSQLIEVYGEILAR
jgi:glycosyltransferase involved in cell wall biosynthesis